MKKTKRTKIKYKICRRTKSIRYCLIISATRTGPRNPVHPVTKMHFWTSFGILILDDTMSVGSCHSASQLVVLLTTGRDRYGVVEAASTISDKCDSGYSYLAKSQITLRKKGEV